MVDAESFRKILMQKYGQVPPITDGEKKEYNIVPDSEKIFGKNVSENDHLEAQERADIIRLAEIAKDTGNEEFSKIAMKRYFELTGETVEKVERLLKVL